MTREPTTGSGSVPDDEIADVIAREFMLPLGACDELEAEAAKVFELWPGRAQRPEGNPASVVDEIVPL